MTARTSLVLLPGLLNDPRLWRHQSHSLADIAEITVGDLTRHDNFAVMAESILETAPPRFALGGLSMGGYLAMEILRRAPERVIKLALFDTSARADTPEQTERRKSMMHLAENGKFKMVLPRLLPQLIHPDRMEDQALVDIVTAMAETVGKDAFLRQQTAIMRRPDSRPSLEALSCPVLVAHGRQDALTGAEIHQEMAALIPGARLVVIEEAGHLSPLEQPQAVSALLRYWLAL
ncbi:MAG: alpha/beta hydrolase [Rhodospirillales bacterium]|nr:alpha/beta hydrolase [Rhodospirillales bacterium]